MVRKLYGGLYLLGFLLILLETGTYTGIVAKYVFLDAKLVFVPLVIFGILINIFSKQKEPSSLLLRINTFFLLPLTACSTVLFTLLEVFNFSNYVYSTFHIHFDSLYFLFLICLFTTLIFLPKAIWERYSPQMIFLGSVLLIISGAIIRVWPEYIFLVLSHEDHLFENLQVIAYGLAAGWSFVHAVYAARKRQQLDVLYFSLFFLLLLFITGEEISWGQRIFAFSTPAYLQANNFQQETTIHNINGLHEYQYLLYMAFSFTLSSAWLIIKFFPKKIRIWMTPLLPAGQFCLYFLPIFFFYLSVNFLAAPVKEWQEYAELLLACGLFLFFCTIPYRKNLP